MGRRLIEVMAKGAAGKAKELLAKAGGNQSS